LALVFGEIKPVWDLGLVTDGGMDVQGAAEGEFDAFRRTPRFARRAGRREADVPDRFRNIRIIVEAVNGVEVVREDRWSSLTKQSSNVCIVFHSCGKIIGDGVPDFFAICRKS